MLEPVNLLGVECVVQHNRIRAAVSVRQDAIQGLKMNNVVAEILFQCNSPLLEQKIQDQQLQPCRQA